MASPTSNPNRRSYMQTSSTNHGANTIPRRGLSHLVSKFEMLDKASGIHRGSQASAHLLPTSQTMSSLSVLDTKRQFEGIPNEYESPGPLTKRPERIFIPKLKTPKLETPKLETPKRVQEERISATVAEKMKVFEPTPRRPTSSKRPPLL